MASHGVDDGVVQDARLVGRLPRRMSRCRVATAGIVERHCVGVDRVGEAPREHHQHTGGSAQADQAERDGHHERAWLVAEGQPDGADHQAEAGQRVPLPASQRQHRCRAHDGDVEQRGEADRCGDRVDHGQVDG